MTYDTKLVEDYWSRIDCSASDRNFYCFPPIRTRSCRLVFNEYDGGRRDWCEYWTVEKYLKDKIPFKKCLSICCGHGIIERILAKLNLAESIVGTDIAPGAIEKAREMAKAEGFNNLTYYVSDLNKDQLPENEYDIVWANGALHHIEKLDVVIPKLRNGLRNGGFLISNEYIGPRYKQMGSRQQEIINAVKHLLPTELRRKNTCHESSLWRAGLSRLLKMAGKRSAGQTDQLDIYGPIWTMPAEEHFLRTDPSECVNSGNIIPLLREHFHDVEVRCYHGSILEHALDSTFYNNFDFANLKHRKTLEMLFLIEDALIETGEIPSDNALIICKKP